MNNVFQLAEARRDQSIADYETTQRIELVRELQLSSSSDVHEIEITPRLTLAEMIDLARQQ